MADAPKGGLGRPFIPTRLSRLSGPRRPPARTNPARPRTNPALASDAARYPACIPTA